MSWAPSNPHPHRLASTQMFLTVPALFCCLWAAAAGAADNLVVDASFESPLPSWFAERAETSYYAGKSDVDEAAEGSVALLIEGWDRAGSTILSPPIRLDEPVPNPLVMSATASVAWSGTVDGATFELALFDAAGQNKIASFGVSSASGEYSWQAVSRAGVPVEPAPGIVRLGLIVAGPQAGGRAYVDCVGLFVGPALEPVTDNSDLVVLEAEELADGTVWKVVDHYPSWYEGTPSGMKMLAGSHGIQPSENRPVTRQLTVRCPGPHVLWLRFQAGPYAGTFTVTVRQQGKICGQREICEDDPQHERQYRWVWDALPVDLQAGDVELELTRPPGESSWVTRKLDLFALTNWRDYQPKVAHFRPSGYLRFTNRSTDQEPFCLWLFVRRHEGPQWYATPGILSHAGLSESYYVPADKTKWLANGDHSPVVRISDYLLAAGGRNNVQLIATRQTHTQGFVTGRIQGRLDFVVGQARRVVKSIAIDQDAPRVLLTLPDDFLNHAEEIKSSRDYIAETEAAIARLGPARASRATALNLAANLSLQAGTDDPEALRREIDILTSLGFNQTYQLIAPPDQAVAFYEQHGLLPRFGGSPWLWNAVKHDSQHHPDIDEMRKRVEAFAQQNAPILDRFVRCKLMDEPGGMSYESLVASPPCGEKFVAWLQGRGLTPQQLGVASWNDVVPVLPDASDAQPELFYWTGLFRLEAFATLAKACVQAKKAYLPDTMLTYVNYSPPTSGGSWTERGTDPFLAHRDGGLEMIWTEDWLGYSLGPQHLSDTLALCRAAGRVQQRRLGAYCVGQGTPTLMRMKYYTLAAGGVRDIETYDYGPWYAGIDSWARQFELFGAIRDCNLEFGAIDTYLDGAVRRATDVAILYNRTASVWAKQDNSCQLNASFTHWALAHAGYDAEYLDEEDVIAGELTRHKVLYLDGPQLPRKVAEVISKWVAAGGVLCGSTGAALRDEYNRPMDVLDSVFGVGSRELAEKNTAGRPKYELIGLKALERLKPTGVSDAPAVELDQLCYQEFLENPATSEILLVDGAGRPAGSRHKSGQGTAIRLAALPGISYAHEATQPPYDPDTYLPQNFRVALRDFIAWPATLAGAHRVGTAHSPIAELVRYDAPDRAVIFVIDHAAQLNTRFTIEIPDAAGFTHAISATGNPVELQPGEAGTLKISLPLNVADAVVLLR
jgi:hypothetical protein